MTDKPLGLHNSITIPDEFNHTKVSEFISTNHAWDVNKLQTFLPDNIIQQIRAKPITSGEERKEILGWPGNASGTFSVRSAFFILAGEQDQTEDHE